MSTIIKFDVSAESVVTHCRECPHWAAFSWTKLQAFAVAEDHLQRVHGLDQRTASAARHQHLQYLTRRAKQNSKTPSA